MICPQPRSAQEARQPTTAMQSSRLAEVVPDVENASSGAGEKPTRVDPANCSGWYCKPGGRISPAPPRFQDKSRWEKD